MLFNNSWGQFHARLLEHEPRRDAGIAVVVLVAVIHHLGNAGLDDGLGALVAGKQSHIHPGALQVVVGAVENGVQLGVADVHILGLQGRALPLPTTATAAGRAAKVAVESRHVLGNLYCCI